MRRGISYYLLPTFDVTSSYFEFANTAFILLFQSKKNSTKTKMARFFKYTQRSENCMEESKCIRDCNVTL